MLNEPARLLTTVVIHPEVLVINTKKKSKKQNKSKIKKKEKKKGALFVDNILLGTIDLFSHNILFNLIHPTLFTIL